MDLLATQLMHIERGIPEIPRQILITYARWTEPAFDPSQQPSFKSRSLGGSRYLAGGQCFQQLPPTEATLFNFTSSVTET